MTPSADAPQRADQPRPGDEIAPSRYRKLPVEIEAIRWSGHNLRQVIDFAGLHPSAEKWTWDEYEEVVRTQGFKIFTLEGPHIVNVGDYIIRGVKGEFYACKPDIFWMTYQRAIAPAAPTTQPSGEAVTKWLVRYPVRAENGYIVDCDGEHIPASYIIDDLNKMRDLISDYRKASLAASPQPTSAPISVLDGPYAELLKRLESPEYQAVTREEMAQAIRALIAAQPSSDARAVAELRDALQLILDDWANANSIGDDARERGERALSLAATLPQNATPAKPIHTRVERQADGTARLVPVAPLSETQRSVPEGMKWGDPLRYTSDDRDQYPYDLVIQQGSNGDWYVSVLQPGYLIGPAVRLCTSGGASSKVPGLTVAIAQAYRALLAAAPSACSVNEQGDRGKSG